MPWLDGDPDVAMARQKYRDSVGDTADDAETLRELLDINSWAALDIEREPRLLGDLITP